MSDNEIPCEYCGEPVEVSEYHIYRQATGDGICSDCYFTEMARGKFKRDTDRRVALAEAEALADYYEDKWLEEVRLPELDQQFEAEGGK